MQTVDMFELLGTKRLEPESIEIVERSLENIYLRATRATFHGASPDPSPPHLLGHLVALAKQSGWLH